MCVRIEYADIIRKLREGLVFFVTTVDIGGNKWGELVKYNTRTLTCRILVGGANIRIDVASFIHQLSLNH